MEFRTFLPIYLLVLLLPVMSCAQNADPFFTLRNRMVKTQIEARGINDEKVLEAFKSVERHKFVLPQYVIHAYNDSPLPIDEGQTISQPYIVAFMTDVLDLKRTDKVLEIGTGSGYQAAILAELCDSVFTIEIFETLANKAQKVFDELGYDNIWCKTGDGYLTSGGTLANLTALLAARKAMTGTNNGKTEDGQKLAVMISAEAHYCVSRALRIMGFDEEGIVKVPVNEAFHLDTTRLEELYKSAVNKGFRVIAVVGSAPSTSTGMYDDIKAIGSFCRHHKIWFHLDGAHGGAVVFSEKYRHLANGIERADSVVIDAHKMLMTPALTTFLLFKNKVHSYSNFSQEAQYLWESAGDEEWYNYAKRTFECTKLMMSIKFFSILKIHGETVFDSFVTTLYDLGKNFAHQVKSRANFQLFLEPHSNIVCFRFFDSSLNEDALNKLNHTIRKEILEEGKFYLVQTSLHQTTYLRVTLMNPGTTPKIISELLDTIEETAKRFM